MSELGNGEVLLMTKLDKITELFVKDAQHLPLNRRKKFFPSWVDNVRASARGKIGLNEKDA